MTKLWFSIFDFSFDYKCAEPPFVDSASFDWANDIESNVNKIKEELSTYLISNHLEGYFNTSMVSKKNSWRTIALKTWNIQLFKNQKSFPNTTKILNKYPQIISASFNLLEANSKILPHCGDTNAIYRCHLGLDIPAGLPDCGLRVKNETRAWVNNKWLIFVDAYEHEAWNNSNKDRYIFLIDVLKDDFRSKKGFVCSTVLTSLFLQKKAETYRSMLKFKPTAIKITAIILRPFARIALYLCNILKIF